MAIAKTNLCFYIKHKEFFSIASIFCLQKCISSYSQNQLIVHYTHAVTFKKDKIPYPYYSFPFGKCWKMGK